ncbi:putative membrane protein [Modestobacter sp. DSM 44400]|uniref:PH domain-containing protein n=1 Tax=Modestobacter sp. DSM 44400 TaxID=1550230 RepID=UPI0008991A6E|nr:PH domain-containing protein [Modestobacter sp. DSM 44400]SDY76182.1 putative membrane protein [Modestobacter sp. DSM 44400]
MTERSPVLDVPLGRPAPQRTSPRVLAVHTITFQQARRLVPVALAVIAGTGLDGGRRTVVALAVGVTLVSLGSATLSWWRFGYAIGNGAVVVTRGLLSRSVRTVPLDRVRGVEVEAPVLHRVFGLVRVRIDAAAGAVGNKDEELVVDGLRREDGDRLRTALLTRRGHPASGVPAGDAATSAGPPAEEPEELISRFDNRWLRYAPLVGGYLAVPLAAVGALVRIADELPDRFVPDVGRPDALTGTVVAGALVAALLVLVVGSVVGAAVVNWRFRLVRRGGSLIAVRGLVTRRHTELEIDRIRGCTVTEGLGMRLAGAGRASALVTGLGDATRRGQLLPLGPRTEAWALSARLVEDPGPLRAHPPAARRRLVVRAVLPGLAVLAAGAVLTPTVGWWALLPAGAALAVLGVPLGLGRYAALGHAAGPHSLAVRAGWLVREHTVLQRRAVLGWQVRQSLFQRQAGLATVLACVGAGSGGYAAFDVAADEVAGFARAASGSWVVTLQPPP